MSLEGLPDEAGVGVSARLGYRSCGKHGETEGFFMKRIDLNCSDCVIWPKRKSDGDYMKIARVLLGADKEPPALVGEQLSLEPST
jgi:hypothetical protein